MAIGFLSRLYRRLPGLQLAVANLGRRPLDLYDNAVIRGHIRLVNTWRCSPVVSAGGVEFRAALPDSKATTHHVSDPVVVVDVPGPLLRFTFGQEEQHVRAGNQHLGSDGAVAGLFVRPLYQRQRRRFYVGLPDK